MSLPQAALIGALFGMFASSVSSGVEIQSLKKRITDLERRTSPLVKLCDGTEDDFYEAFYRLVQEGCAK